MITGMGPSTSAFVLDAIVAVQGGDPSSLVDSERLAETSLIGQFVRRAAQHLDAAAVSTPRLSLTYRDILAAAIRIAATIQSCPNFQPGSRVLLLSPNSAEYVAAYFGTLLAGAVIVPLPPSIEDKAFERIFDLTNPITVMYPASARRLPSAVKEMSRVDTGVVKNGAQAQSEAVNQTKNKAPDAASSRRAGPRSQPSTIAHGDLCLESGRTTDAPLPASIDDDLAAIFFTSGSTGDPKGVMLSNRNLIQNTTSIQQYLEITESDRPLCVLPFFHAFGNSVLLSHLLAGATLILDGKTLFPETLVTAITTNKVTSVSGVPDLFRLLLERTSLGKSQLPSLRYMAVAGGSLPHDLALQVAQRLAPAKFFVMYGQTEATARLAFVPPKDLATLSDGCIGQAVPGVELQVVDEHGQQVAPDETGELRALGPNVMLGYWQDEKETADRIRDGWLYTGDLAARDANGWIYLRGRRNAIVKIAGFRVHPSDLEEFAIRRLFVKQAVAVSFEQPQVGTRLALFIRGPESNELTTSEMLDRCRAELPRHLAPSFIRRVDDFPLNSAMKIDRIRLSQLAERDALGTHSRLVPEQSVVKGIDS